jgi:hypothetical protein
MQIGASPEAVQTLTSCSKRTPPSSRPRQPRPRPLPTGPPRRIRKGLPQAARTRPQTQPVYYHLGEIDYQRGKGAEAKRHYQRFLETPSPAPPRPAPLRNASTTSPPASLEADPNPTAHSPHPAAPPRRAPRRHARSLHIITRLIVGGAQENTVASVLGLRRLPGAPNSTSSAAPPTAPRAPSNRSPPTSPALTLLPSLVRPVHPLPTPAPSSPSPGSSARDSPPSSTPIAAKPASSAASPPAPPASRS